MTTHPMHLFDPALKSRTGKPTRPVRLSSTTPNDVFLNALLEMPTTKSVRRSPLEWVAATGLHIAIFAALIIVPLYTTGTIQLDNYKDTPLAAPPAAPPPPPAAVGTVVAAHITSKRPNLTYRLGKVTAPVSSPKTVSLDNESAATDLGGVVGGVPGGVAGGDLGGSLGGVLGGTGTSVPVPPPQQPAAKRIVRVGSNLKAPRQTFSVQPEYPVLARQTHVSGTVVVNAVIDEHGNVVGARALSGHLLLIPAALKAVLQWKYEPTLLNGTPVAVEMEVTVHFSLGS
ncbi:MAG TPA: energy transducer TonB [Candidatus Cybelea sp.]|nr:energy transducer TonB [Candidatus Cybelea sp.]